MVMDAERRKILDRLNTLDPGFAEFFFHALG